MNWDLVLIGLAIAVSPLTVVSFILLLATDRGAVKGVGYLVGWVVCLGVVIGGTLVLTGGKPPRPDTAPRTAVSVVQVIVGAGLLALAWRTHLRSGGPADAERKQPRWVTRLDEMSLLAAAVLAALLQPWGLVAAGAAVAADVDLGPTSSKIAVAVFALLATSSLLIMEGWAVVAPESATAKLAALQRWAGDHRAPILTLVESVVGVVLVVKGMDQLIG
jgi:hypothetical protein